jgi:hypothetical protein
MGDKENGKNGDRLTNKEYTKELRSLQAELGKKRYDDQTPLMGRHSIPKVY